MNSVVLLSFLNTTLLGLQPLQVQTVPGFPISSPSCSANLAPPETSFSLWNGTTPQVVCRNREIVLTRWNGTTWSPNQPLGIPQGSNLRTAADGTSERWWLNVQSTSSTGGNGGRSLVYAFPDGRAIYNSSEVTIQDIQWSPAGLYIQGSPTGIGLFRTGIGLLNAASGLTWLSGTLRTSILQTFIAPRSRDSNLYTFTYGTNAVMETWTFDITTGSWAITSTVSLSRILGTVLRAYLVDSTIWIMTNQMVGIYSLLLGNSSVLFRAPPFGSYVSMIPGIVAVPPWSLPSNSPSPTLSPSSSGSSSPSASASITPFPTLTPSASFTPTPSPTPGLSRTASPSITGTRTVTATSTATPTSAATFSTSSTPTGTSSPSMTSSASSFESPPPPSGNTNGTSISGLSPGAQAGISIGAIVGVAFLGGLGFFAYKQASFPWSQSRVARPMKPRSSDLSLHQARAEMLKKLQTDTAFINRADIVDKMKMYKPVVIQNYGEKTKKVFNPLQTVSKV